MGRLRTLPDDFMHAVLNINYFTNANSLQRSPPPPPSMEQLNYFNTPLGISKSILK